MNFVEKHRRTLIWGAVASFALFQILTLDHFPIFWNDEAMYAELARTNWEGGRPRAPSMGETAGVDQHYLMSGRIHLWLLGAADAMTGPSIRSLRFIALMAGFASLVGFILLGRWTGRPAAGWIAAGLFGISDEFYRHAHEVRPEMLMTACFLGSLLLVVRAMQQERARGLLWAGLVMGLGMQVHPNAVVFIAAIGMGAFYGFRWRSAWFLLGVLPGILWWYGQNVFADPAFFSYQWEQWWFPQFRLEPFPAGSFAAHWNGMLGLLTSYFWVSQMHFKVVLGVILFLGVVGALFSKDRWDRLILIVVGTHWVCFTLFTRQLPNYVYYFVPLSLFLTVRLFQRMEGVSFFRQGVLPKVAIGSLALYCCASTAVAAFQYTGSGHRQERYFEYAREVRSHIPEGRIILGPAALWYGMADYPYRSTLLLWCDWSEDGRKRYSRDLRTILQRAGIEYVVLEQQTKHALAHVMDGQDDEAGRPRRGMHEVETLISGWEKVGEVESHHYGSEGHGFRPGTVRTTLIYRIPSP